VESPLRGDTHGGFGGRPEETGQRKRWDRASGRPYVVMVAGTRADAQALKAETAAVLAPMGLGLSEAKTRITHIDEGLDFLGYRVQRHRKRGTAKRFVYTYPSKKALGAIMAKVRTISRQNRNQPLAVLLHRLNLALRAGASTSDMGARPGPSATCASSHGNGSSSGSGASTPTPPGSDSAAATCQAGGRRTAAWCCSTPRR
jgi:hypothetical protein